jgi:hypothetical protein
MVIGTAMSMLTAGLGMALPIVPMEVNIPCAGGVAMLLCLVSCALTLWTDGPVCRPEGALLIGLYLLYLGVHLRYLALLIRGDFS